MGLTVTSVIAFDSPGPCHLYKLILTLQIVILQSQNVCIKLITFCKLTFCAERKPSRTWTLF